MGGGIAVAEQVAKNPRGGAGQAQTLLEAVHESFAHAIAHTSLVGAVIMAAGTLIVIAVLPGHKATVTGEHHQEESARSPEETETVGAA